MFCFSFLELHSKEALPETGLRISGSAASDHRSDPLLLFHRQARSVRHNPLEIASRNALLPESRVALNDVPTPVDNETRGGRWLQRYPRAREEVPGKLMLSSYYLRYGALPYVLYVQRSSLRLHMIRTYAYVLNTTYELLP